MTNPEIRQVFARNLVELCKAYRSVSKAAVAMGINRTQLNRYRTGERFPNPDVLARICQHFGVDANILLVPLDQLPAQAAKFLLNEPKVQEVLKRSSSGHEALTIIATKQKGRPLGEENDAV